MVTQINENELKESIENSKKPILVDFYANWCGPCKMSEPLLEEFSKDNSDLIDFYKVDVDENGELAQEYGIRNIPYFLLIEGGEIKGRLIGAPTKEKLDNFISDYKKN
jgi:thioredoxin 1